MSVRDLFITSLRMRPDRIVVGEVRRGEALDMIQAMTSGHRGALTTVHASSSADTCYRLETMALMADIALPLYALRRQLASAIDVIVQTDRLPDGRRMVTSIAQVDLDESASRYMLTELFHLAGSGSDRKLEWTGVAPRFAGHLAIDSIRDNIRLTEPLFKGALS